MDVAILRKSNKEQFTSIPQGIFRDKRLSLKDIGLLTSMLSLPDNWEFSENGLEAIFPNDGQTSIRTGLKKLEQTGYLSRKRQRGENGQITGVIWYLMDAPCGDKPHCENHSLENPNWANQPQSNTKQSNTKESITDTYLLIPAEVESDQEGLEEAIINNYKKILISKLTEEIESYIDNFDKQVYLPSKCYLKDANGTTITTFKRNSFGNPLEIVSMDSNGNILNKSIHEYDDNNESIKYECYHRYENGELKLVASNIKTSEYSEDDKLISTTWTDFWEEN